MRLWRDNSIDGEWDLPEEEIARRFLASDWADVAWPLDRALRAFMTDKGKGGLSSVWEDGAAYDRVFDIVLQARCDAREDAPR